MSPGPSAYPRITIVTPNLNQGAHLEACLKSVLDQGYPNLEYIVVDGGSTDGSVAIIEHYASRLHRWFSEPDAGPYHAVQKGFNCSTGEIMAWLNSDDKYHGGALFAMAETFRRFPDVQWLTGYPTEYTDHGVAINRVALPWARWSRYRYLTWDFGFIQQESTCWRRELWEKAGATLDLDMKLAGDMELWARFFRHARLHTSSCLIGGFRYSGERQRSRVFRSEYLAECRAVIRRERRLQPWPLRAALPLLRVAGWPLGAPFFLDVPLLRAPYRFLFRIPPTLSYDFERQAYIRGGRTIRYPQLFVFGRGFREGVAAACATLRTRRLRDGGAADPGMGVTRDSRSRAVPAAVPTLESPLMVPIYADCLERTRTALLARLAAAPAGDLLREYFARGKMLRASLVFAAAAAVGGDPDDAVIGAEAIELLHGASLFHDDIIDKAAERRGLASLHMRLGIGPALVVGDDLLLRAFAVLAEARASHPAARVLEATAALNELARECCRGQLEELCSARWVSEEKYLEIVRGKTAAPFVAAGVVGAILGGGTSAHVSRIRAYAGMIGVAFQIGDDLLDLTGEARLIGKPAGNSLAQGRPMLPLIYLRRIGSDVARAEFARLAENGGPRHQLVELLGREGILDRVRRLQQDYVDAALAALEDLPDAAGADALRALAAHATAPSVSGGPVYVRTPASA